MAIDHGTRRMGIALSDELKMLAHPLEYIPADPFQAFLERLKQIIREKEVELILIGLPRNMNGSYGPAALRVQDFAAVLRNALSIPVQTWDERLTTVQARRYLRDAAVPGRKQAGKADQSAAAILLQSYLDSFEDKTGHRL